MIQTHIYLTFDNIPYMMYYVITRPNKGELIKMIDYTNFKIVLIQHTVNSDIVNVYVKPYKVIGLTDAQLQKIGFKRQDI